MHMTTALKYWWVTILLAAASAKPDLETAKFRSVLRPAHWGGLELPGQPSSSKQRRVHGAVHPHVVRLPKSAIGFNTYRVYLEMSSAQAGNIYARMNLPRHSFGRYICCNDHARSLRGRLRPDGALCRRRDSTLVSGSAPIWHRHSWCRLEDFRSQARGRIRYVDYSRS